MSRNQLVLHYSYYCPPYRQMDKKAKVAFIDKAIKFKDKHGYVPEFWEIKS